MSDQTRTGQEPGQGTGTGQEPNTGQPHNDPWADPETARNEIERLRNEAAGWRTKLREQEPFIAAGRKAQEAEEASKSEIAKALDRAANAEAQVAQLEQAQMRWEIGAAAGLTPAQSRRLVGATREELEADAKAYAAESGTGPNGKPRTDLKQGSRGSNQVEDPNEWLRKLAIRKGS